MNKVTDRILTIFISFRTAVVLLVLYAVLLAIATWIEKTWGTSMARSLVYCSPFFFILQLLMVAVFFVYASKRQYLSGNRLGLLFTHLSFVVILAGAGITHYYGEEGLLHLREGEKNDMMLVREADGTTSTMQLPFSVRLNDFVLKRYPGSGSPSSYESLVTILENGKEYDAHIYMNNVFDVAGYRLYQTSFDADERGSVLSVSHDAAGRNVTYTGYLLLLVGLLASLAGRSGRFRQLYKRLNALQLRSVVIWTVFLVCGAVTHAADGNVLRMVEKYFVNEAHAARFGQLPVQATNGRMMPVNTFSSEVLRKLYKADRIGSLNSDQFLISFLLMPDVWAELPCIAVDNAELATRYGLTFPHTSFSQLFDSQGYYKLQMELDTLYRKNPSLRNRQEKDMLKLDERANVFHLLTSRQLLRLFPLPADSTHAWYAPGDDLSAFAGKDSMFVSRIFDWYMEEVVQAMGSGNWEMADEVLGMIDTYQQAKATGVEIAHNKMEAEVKYNRMKVFARCRVGYLILGGLSLLWALGTLFGVRHRKWIKWLLVGCVFSVFLFHSYGMAMRWYVGGYAPWSNSYETMVYVAWATVLAGLLFVWRNLLVFALAALFGGVILFVSGLNWMDPQITTLVPVLKSPWLMFHVAVIVGAYGFFGLSSLIGTTNLSLMCVLPYSRYTTRLRVRIHELSLINEMSLWIGLALMTTGTFLGAVWANESWGRYWGWDPKETWALITMVVYAIVTHIHLLRYSKGEWLFNLLSVVAIASVLMTFFGVNYFLSGMHSYGQNDHIANLFVWIGVAFGAVFLLGLVSWKAAKKEKLDLGRSDIRHEPMI